MSTRNFTVDIDDGLYFEWSMKEKCLNTIYLSSYDMDTLDTGDYVLGVF